MDSSASVIICSYCSARSTSLSLWMSHLRQVHSNEHNLSLTCPLPNCTASYSNVNSLCSHIYRKHQDRDSIPGNCTHDQNADGNEATSDTNLFESSASVIICSYCSARSTSLSLWMSHLRQVHSNEHNLSLTCPLPNCTASYSNVNSLCSHIYHKHQDRDSIPGNSTYDQNADGNEATSDTNLVESVEALSNEEPSLLFCPYHRP